MEKTPAGRGDPCHIDPAGASTAGRARNVLNSLGLCGLAFVPMKLTGMARAAASADFLPEYPP